MTVRAVWWPAAAFCAASLGAARASADEETCRRAYVETQRLQRAAQFQAARREAVTCGQDACSGTVRAQCTTWLESIERALPTLVLDARDGAGAALAEVRVEANGKLLTERLNGRALELDPGEYSFRFFYRGRVVEQRTLIREAEKYRTVEVRFGSPEPVSPERAREPSRADAPLPPSDAPGQAPPTPIPTASYVLGGLGLAGVATFAALASSGFVSERELRKSCASDCDTRRVDSVRDRYLLADTALGVGVAALGAAFAVWAWQPSPTATQRLALGPCSLLVEGEF